MPGEVDNSQENEIQQPVEGATIVRPMQMQSNIGMPVYAGAAKAVELIHSPFVDPRGWIDRQPGTRGDEHTSI